MSAPAIDRRQDFRTLNGAYQNARPHIGEGLHIRIYRITHTSFVWRLPTEPAPTNGRLAHTVHRIEGQWPARITG